MGAYFKFLMVYTAVISTLAFIGIWLLWNWLHAQSILGNQFVIHF